MKTDLLKNEPLYKLWEKIVKNSRIVTKPNKPGEWNEQAYHLSLYGRGGEETLNFLYSKQPTYEAFVDWILLAHQPAKMEFPKENVLTKEDWDFWNSNGYLVVKNAVPAAQCEAAQAAIWEFLDADIADPESWYKADDGKNGLMLHLFQHSSLANNRNSPLIRKVYQELYGETDIYLLVDKVSFNPPERGSYSFHGSALHWDVSLQLPIPFVLQGLLYLNDVAAGDGAFHCVPGFHTQINEWLASLPADVNPRQEAVKQLKPVPVPGNAGDFIIWHQALPHCATPNKGSLPRMVQYMAYKPVQMPESAVWI